MNSRFTYLLTHSLNAVGLRVLQVKIRHKALPADYYFYSEDQDFNFTNTCTAVPLQEHEGTGNVIVTIAPIGNGRVRELTDSIPEEPDSRGSPPQYCNSQ